MREPKKCYCTNTQAGIANCTMCGDGCIGPMTDADDKLLDKLFNDLSDVPGFVMNDHYKQKWRRLIRDFTCDIRQTPVDLLLKERFK